MRRTRFNRGPHASMVSVVGVQCEHSVLVSLNIWVAHGQSRRVSEQLLVGYERHLFGLWLVK